MDPDDSSDPADLSDPSDPSGASVGSIDCWVDRTPGIAEIARTVGILLHSVITHTYTHYTHFQISVITSDLNDPDNLSDPDDFCDPSNLSIRDGAGDRSQRADLSDR